MKALVQIFVSNFVCNSFRLIETIRAVREIGSYVLFYGSVI